MGFRGHKRHDYPLAPSIKPVHACTDWSWAEHRALCEFHMDPRQLPPATPDDKLSSLAIMQHYGAPTRLIDFTFSPHVALFFALRNGGANESEYAEA